MDDVGKRGLFLIRLLGVCIIEEGRDHPVEPLHLLYHDLAVFMIRAPRWILFQEELGKAFDRTERVPDLMRDPCSQASEGSEAFTPRDPFLQRLDLSEIPQDKDCPEILAVFGSELSGADRKGDRPTTSAWICHLLLDDRPLFLQGCKERFCKRLKLIR